MTAAISGVLAFSPLTSRTCALEVWVTNPWLSMITRFIGGVQANVHPIFIWDNNRAVKNGRLNIPGGALVIAVNEEDAASALGRSDPKRYSVSLLFKGIKASGMSIDENFLDPAALPFIGLRTLEILSAHDPANYDYYQRRLAEFQARLDSTVIVGRNMIGDKTVLDLSWRYGRWIQAAAESVIRPPDKVKMEWSQGVGMDVLDTAIEEARSQKWIILADPWTPAPVREKSQKASGFIDMPAPKMEGDMILFLYDMYLQIWDYTRKSP